MSEEPVIPGLLSPKTFNIAELEHRQSPSFLQVYTNNTTFGINFFDLSMTFGQIVSPEPSKMHIEERVTVTMTMEHAEALLHALQTTLEHYKKTHGPIRKAPTADKI